MSSHPIKRILVSLDLTAHDKVLLKYVSKLSTILNLDAVYYLNVANDLEIPEEILETYPDLIAPIDETLEKEIQFELDNYASIDGDVQTQILIREGKTTNEVLKAIKQKEIDLLVLGRKNNRLANLNVVKKIVRAAPCSISLIPEYIPDKLDKVLIPVDFSDNSSLSFERAEFFQSKFPDLEVVALNAFEVPQGYSKTGKSFKEFAAIMEENAKKQAQTYIQQNEINLNNLQWEFVCINNLDLHTVIYEFAITQGVNVILMCSKGRNALSSLIVGSVTEAVIEHDQYLPVIIMKDRNETMGILDAIKNL